MSKRKPNTKPECREKMLLSNRVVTCDIFTQSACALIFKPCTLQTVASAGYSGNSQAGIHACMTTCPLLIRFIHHISNAYIFVKAYA